MVPPTSPTDPRASSSSTRRSKPSSRPVSDPKPKAQVTDPLTADKTTSQAASSTSNPGKRSSASSKHGAVGTPATSLTKDALEAMAEAERGSTASPGATAARVSAKMSKLSRTREAIIGDNSGPAAAETAKSRSPDGGMPGAAVQALAVPSSSQLQLNEYRERLARDLEMREMSARGMLFSPSEKFRPSPISEEAAFSSPNFSTSVTTASTESGNTIRGGMTPALTASTPSYPFPRMAASAFAQPHTFRPYYTSSSPQMPIGQSYETFSVQEKVLSGNSTPASNFTFNPPGSSRWNDNPDFPNPNLYDLSLMLAAEPGLDAWWATVVQIMKDVYRAERVTLAIPADTTDIENVPWGQKATYNEHHADDLSVDYLSTGQELPSSHGDSESPGFADPGLRASDPSRPGLFSRHSFTSYEDNKEPKHDQRASMLRRPSQMARSRSYLPSHRSSADLSDHAQLSKTNLDEHDATDEQGPIPEWEMPPNTYQEGRGRVLPVLQALDYEADPLIDHTGIIRVLERGKAVALTRSYPYLASGPPSDQSGQPKETRFSGSEKPKKPKRPHGDSSKLTSMFPGSSTSRSGGKGKIAGDKGKAQTSAFDEGPPRPPTPKYEEYEQAPPSPWSQSPAPSPAVRPDPKENPFFTDAMVDEDSFNPESAASDYTGMPPPEAIGIDNSWTVLHIPLSHVLLSKPTNLFKLDASAMEQRAQARNDEGWPSRKDAEEATPESAKRSKPAPIAILSILTPIIPYPSNLRHSLENLAPHMATSFSLCRHYSNLETELAGIQRRRPSTTGFGAISGDGRPLHNHPYMGGEDIPLQMSVPGSITSPSDYSAVSKSATGSPSGTPNWDSGSLGAIVDKKMPAASPLSVGGESYFSSKQRPGSARSDAWNAASGQRSRGGSKDNSPGEKRLARFSNAKPLEDVLDEEEPVERARKSTELTAGEPSRRVPSKDGKDSTTDSSVDFTGGDFGDRTWQPTRSDSTAKRQVHSMLHSYGADFASTFQSLPPSSTVHSRPPPPMSLPSRSGSLTSTTAADMPPPSDRLKGLILDSLPAHVFVALPQTGEIVWVNSRYLSYRGQTVSDLSVDPWASIHPDDIEDYLKAWGRSIRTGEQFSRTVRIKRFDGAYRWFYARAVASKDKRGVIMQFLGSYMDIHDQHIAELKAARQEEIEASEAKHRLLANLIPQIIFTATEEDGITFANEQWLSYTGQSFEDSLGLGFMDFVHPEDLAKCRIPIDQPPTPLDSKTKKPYQDILSETSSTTATQGPKSAAAQDSNLRGVYHALSRNNSSSSSSMYEVPTADLTELARKGIVKVAKDANGRLSYTTEVRLRSKSGEYRWHLIRCVEIDTIDFGSGASSYFGSATDINDHKLLEAKLKEAMESKGRFLSNMSHEIRTPLIGISGMVSFLQDTILNEEQRDYTNTIQTSANSLIMIINDILDLSKVDAGMMKLKFEWFHTRSLIEDVNELVSTMAIAKRLELNYLVEADVPAWVKGDKVRIRQVLLNVIGNAIKFTAEGEVFSRCKVIAEPSAVDGENEIMLQFAITDTGRGFTEKEAELIFKPFSQIDGSSTRQHGGSGLGLVISRQLVELHGGTMEGTAVPGRGSTFTFTAKFALPTADDHPDIPGSPVPIAQRRDSPEAIPTAILKSEPQRPRRSVDDPVGALSDAGSPAVTSTGSSNPSIHSARSRVTGRSSATSVNTGLARFSEAAKASGQDLSQMKLEMPTGRSSPGQTATPDHPHGPQFPELRPPLYSILIICPQLHSREATTAHIEMTLPKDVPHQITALGTVGEAQQYIGGDDPSKLTHIVINLGSPAEIIALVDQVTLSQKNEKIAMLILSDSVQRQAVMRLAAGTRHERILTSKLVTFIYKPVKPSRFAVIFDPEKVGDLSVDLNRSSAQQMVENQKASYQEIEHRMGNKGYRVLVVEDNPINRKVLTKYLSKIGVTVEVAVDGMECTKKVLSKPHSYYALILCDLHMPRKDGYQACRDIRRWERESDESKMPIIALSANVMSDVQEKCVAAGFSDYVTKPFDFIHLSQAMAQFFD